ncbi:MAG: DUF2478 domain-containing protein [Rhodospirillales bacterium]|nr:DUF2478 domain-containing protein [Rhodospirillales bacterium]
MTGIPKLALPRLRPAGVVYTPTTRELPLLSEFAADLASRGWRVGGLTQKIIRDPDGYKKEILATELDTGKTVSLAQYRGDRRKESECGFDTAVLAETTQALRRAIREKADLIIVEKFSRREMEGAGLADEIIAAMAEGIPTLTLVSAGSLDEWQAFTGGLTDLLPADKRALWRWWGPHRLYRDLELDVGDIPAKRVLIGFNWVLVESAEGCGLAQTPDRGRSACRKIADASSLRGRPLRDLAGLIHSLDGIEAAIGLAAINAHYNRFDLTGPPDNGLEDFAPSGEPITVIGRFPNLGERLGNVTIIEREPADGETPDWAAPWVLPESEYVIATASTLVNRSLPGLIEACNNAEIAIVGPSAPLTPRLFDYGISRLGGLVIEDVEGAATAIAEGGSVKAIKPFARMVTLSADNAT